MRSVSECAASVEVVLALRSVAYRQAVAWRAGLTVEQALAEVAHRPGFVRHLHADTVVSVYGEVVERGHQLSADDRVEILRPLPTDPKSARRARAETQNAVRKRR